MNDALLSKEYWWNKNKEHLAHILTQNIIYWWLNSSFWSQISKNIIIPIFTIRRKQNANIMFAAFGFPLHHYERLLYHLRVFKLYLLCINRTLLYHPFKITYMGPFINYVGRRGGLAKCLCYCISLCIKLVYRGGGGSKISKILPT